MLDYPFCFNIDTVEDNYFLHHILMFEMDLAVVNVNQVYVPKYQI
jgi:hypothetical protein